MEVEAKFVVPDEGTFRDLQAAGALAGYELMASRVKRVHDTYLDTTGRLILAAGYACRRREQDDGVLVTLKGLGAAEDAIHRREELEVLLPASAPPMEWPASPVRERVLQLIGEATLEELFELYQVRNVRAISTGQQEGREEQVVAEWSLDQVRVVAAGQEQTYFELEIELTGQGTEDDLAAIATCLQDAWGLRPEPRSKFERGLALLDKMISGSRLLNPQEQAVCQEIAARDDLHGRRAQALLALDEGATQAKAGRRAGMSDRRVRYWLAAFRQERLDVFPARVLGWAAEQAQVGDEAERAPEVAPEPERQPEVVEAVEVPTPEPWPLETLFERYEVDPAHARAVADNALLLFDRLAALHGLPPKRRSLLEVAALVHNVGLETDPARHQIVGRDILVAHPPAGLSDAEGRIVALTTLLHRKRITAKKLAELSRESLFSGLAEASRAEALALAALVRLGDGLDYSQTGSSQIGRIGQQEKTVSIEVVGPCAEVDARRAQKKGDLWNLLFGTELRFWTAEMAGVAEDERLVPISERAVGLEEVPMPSQPGLEPDDPMAEAARKTFYFHFRRMLHHEPGTRLGEDIEELHDMRVATRRMRAAVRVFGDYLDMGRMKPFIKGMRRTGRALGRVRDLDVFWEKTQHYLDGLPVERQDELVPLRAVWEAERDDARARMLAYLDSDAYRRFAERFGEFLQDPDKWAVSGLSDDGVPLPHRLRHVVPVAVHQRLAAVRAYDEWVTRPDVPMERLHQLRIASKGLRYTVEYFREVLAPDAKDLIDEIKGLQDHLGDFQDAVVACNLLRDFLTWGTWGHAQQEGKSISIPEEPIVAPGVVTYLAARQMELQHLLDTFPEVWARIQNPEFSQLVARVLVAL
jgi:CHAD domain-containing protein